MALFRQFLGSSYVDCVVWLEQIARMLTVRREREIERGVGLRESRKLDREWKRNIVIRPPASYAATLAEQNKK